MSNKVAEEVRLDADNEQQIAINISRWAKNNLIHTQQVEAFKGQPGDDPWGAYNSGQPVWKKVIPSEMLAKSMYSGKITGKCEALPSFLASIFVLNGAKLDDVILLRLHSHNIGLVRFGGKLYIINNQSVMPVDEKRKSWIKEQTYLGFFSYSVSVYHDFRNGDKEFKIDDAFFNTEDNSLLDTFLNMTGTRDKLVKDENVYPNAVGNRDGAFSLIFNNSDSVGVLKNCVLARYAYQSLYVKNPEMYLKASIKAPKTLELANMLGSKEDIFGWIKNHVSYGSIFEDSSERIMTGDQVIVFKKGSLKDQAVLAFSLLKLKGYNPEMVITEKNAFIRVDNDTYEAKTWDKVESIEGKVFLKMSL
ncbi:hypothetical protein [Sporomusa ovata]|uniref:hypothetical protein n=1 Tax=Sporomusa ovata TaxID=2378 RepID=UPI001268F2FC|nr:hypothetical protein [Sporomusa ovata]